MDHRPALIEAIRAGAATLVSQEYRDDILQALTMNDRTAAAH